MSLQTNEELAKSVSKKEYSKINENTISKDGVEFVSEVGWRLEKKRPTNNNHYSDLLEDTDWKSNEINFRFSKHYRRDLDALS